MENPRFASSVDLFLEIQVRIDSCDCEFGRKEHALTFCPDAGQIIDKRQFINLEREHRLLSKGGGGGGGGTNERQNAGFCQTQSRAFNAKKLVPLRTQQGKRWSSLSYVGNSDDKQYSLDSMGRSFQQSLT